MYFLKRFSRILWYSKVFVQCSFTLQKVNALCIRRLPIILNIHVAEIEHSAVCRLNWK
jgi:hypothetical protein